MLTGQPMLAAVLVLLSSTPCSPGTAREPKPMQMWTPLGCSVQSRRPPERPGGRPGPAWSSTAPGGGGRRRRHGLYGGYSQTRQSTTFAQVRGSLSCPVNKPLCLWQGSVARRQWPAPKPQLVAPGPVQYRRGGIKTSSATPGPPTARTNAPPSSPHPATTRSLRGRVIWSTGLRWGHSTRTGTFPYPRGHAARTGTGFLHPLTSNASVRA